ncbi:MFS transporter [Gordonia rhizosphera]|uniref:Putative major facilitator superfamily transporter n=1 Tax=Gordonia rhizosphera NBRC 16068 TaxID=1108045 RepID=K6WI22_9ACTN|nr:MFS transporter [Gordonia rhizosphera]GAB93421.1 putative major facilitator superfamily transporter [Gordonia rhizosphera NBRC 16068]
MTTTHDLPAPAPRKAALASFMGSLVEYYDFFIFGTASALVFNKIFFPEFSSGAGTLAAFATFGMAYVARPIGAVVLGHFGDRIGRQRVLVFTLVLMGLSTFLIGCLPDYNTIGIAAPIALVVLRLMQGLSAAGEQSGASSLTVEHADSGKRAFYASWTLNGTQAGLLVGTLTFIPVAALPDDILLSWGWRVPFLFSAVVMAIAYIIRRSLPETPVFEKVKDAEGVSDIPLLVLLRFHWRALLRVILCATVSVMSTLFSTFALKYATDDFEVTKSSMLLISVIANLVMLVSQPLWGIAADRIGRKPVFLGGAIGCAVLAFPYLAIITTGSFWAILFATLVIQSVVYAAANAIWPSFYSEMFPARVRYSGVAIGTQLGFMASGFLPLIASAILGEGQLGWLPVAIVVAAFSLIAAIAAATAKETHKTDTMALGENGAGTARTAPATELSPATV